MKITKPIQAIEETVGEASTRIVSMSRNTSCFQLQLFILLMIGQENMSNKCQTLLNQDSQLNIIKALLAKHFRFPSLLCRAIISGIENSLMQTVTIHDRIRVELISKCTRFRISYLLMNKIISNISNFRISVIRILPQSDHLSGSSILGST